MDEQHESTHRVLTEHGLVRLRGSEKAVDSHVAFVIRNRGDRVFAALKAVLDGYVAAKLEAGVSPEDLDRDSLVVGASAMLRESRGAGSTLESTMWLS